MHIVVIGVRTERILDIHTEVTLRHRKQPLRILDTHTEVTLRHRKQPLRILDINIEVIYLSN